MDRKIGKGGGDEEEEVKGGDDEGKEERLCVGKAVIYAMR